ncbi:hypothetical protein BH10BDE1_BH10BDE1_24100 [soil metagenome]
MSSQTKKTSFVTVVLVVLAVAGWWVRPGQISEKPKPISARKEIYNFDLSACPGKTIDVKVADPYLRGLVEEGQIVKTEMNAYRCHPIKKGDVALYRFSEFDDPVFRRVIAVGGDHFDVVEDEQNGGWQIKVNGKRVTGLKNEV